MDLKDIRILKILEKAEDQNLPSQRDLARELNISLGLVNSFLKRLAKKGYFKITTIPKNRIRYILTPKGAAEKTRLTYEYIQHSYRFYKDARQKLHNLFAELENGGEKHIIFYGAGDLAEIAYISLQETSIELIAIVDDDNQGKKFMGYLIEQPSQLESKHFDKLLITTVDSRDRVIAKLAKIGITSEKIAEIH